MSVAKAVTDAVKKKLGGNVPKKVKVFLEVGRLRFHDTEQVDFWIGEMIRNEIDEGIDVATDITVVDPIIVCGCGYAGSMPTDDDAAELAHHGILEMKCPSCGSTDTTVKNGNECRITKLVLS